MSASFYESSSFSGEAAGDVGDYFALLKPRVMSLVIFTALVGMTTASSQIHPVLAAISLLAIAVGAGASGCLNMWWDSDIDAVMRRTQNRPIPANRITREEALAFGLFLSGGSVIVLGLAANGLAAGLLAFTIVFYAVIYTMGLKRRTVQNIVIGGLAGALPPVIGDAAVSGSVGMPSLILCLIIFLWTPPHFWALALIRSEDYARAKVPMMPNVAGEASTRFQILAYTLVLVPVALSPFAFGFGGWAYLAVALAGGLCMIGLAVRVFRAPAGVAANKACGQLFGFSIVYLFGLFAVLLVESLFDKGFI